MEFHVLRIGDVAFVAERCELYTDFGRSIQARSPLTQIFTIQLSAGLPDLPDGVAGYLPTARSLPNGGYQSHPVNNRNAPSPEGGQRQEIQSRSCGCLLPGLNELFGLDGSRPALWR